MVCTGVFHVLEKSLLVYPEITQKEKAEHIGPEQLGVLKKVVQQIAVGADIVLRFGKREPQYHYSHGNGEYAVCKPLKPTNRQYVQLLAQLFLLPVQIPSVLYYQFCRLTDVSRSGSFKQIEPGRYRGQIKHSLTLCKAPFLQFSARKVI